MLALPCDTCHLPWQCETACVCVLLHVWCQVPCAFGLEVVLSALLPVAIVWEAYSAASLVSAFKKHALAILRLCILSPELGLRK